MAKTEEKKTVFRRIQGRIVPISVGASAIGAGHIIGSEKLFDKHIRSWLYTGKIRRSNRMTPGHYRNGDFSNKFTRIMESKYADQLKKANVSEIVSDNPHILPWARTTSLLQIETMEGKTKLKIMAVDRSRFGVLHELAHAQSITDKSKTYKWALKGKGILHKNMIKDIETSSLKRAMLKSKPGSLKRKILASKSLYKLEAFASKQERALGYALELPEEAKAWWKGSKYLNTNKRKIAMLKSGIKPFMSYAAFPLQQGLRLGAFTAGLGLIGYGAFRKYNNQGSEK